MHNYINNIKYNMGFEDGNKTIEKVSDSKNNILKIAQTEAGKLKIDLTNESKLDKKTIEVVQREINQLPKIMRNSLLKGRTLHNVNVSILDNNEHKDKEAIAFYDNDTDIIYIPRNYLDLIDNKGNVIAHEMLHSIMDDKGNLGLLNQKFISRPSNKEIEEYIYSNIISRKIDIINDRLYLNDLMIKIQKLTKKVIPEDYRIKNLEEYSDLYEKDLSSIFSKDEYKSFIWLYSNFRKDLDFVEKGLKNDISPSLNNVSNYKERLIINYEKIVLLCKNKKFKKDFYDIYLYPLYLRLYSLFEYMNVYFAKIEKEKSIEYLISPEENLARMVDSLISGYNGPIIQNNYPLNKKDLEFLGRFKFKGEKIFGEHIEKYKKMLFKKEN